MKPRLRAPFDALVYLTLVVPEIVIAVASLISLVQAHRYIHGFPELGMATILLGQSLQPLVAMLIIRARFVGMGDTLEEAAYDLGSGPLATFRQITLLGRARHRGRRPVVVVLLIRRLRLASIHERHHEHLADRAVFCRALRPHSSRECSRHDHARRHSDSNSYHCPDAAP